MKPNIVITEDINKLPFAQKASAELIIETTPTEFRVVKNRHGVAGETGPRELLSSYLAGYEHGRGEAPNDELCSASDASASAIGSPSWSNNKNL